MPNYEVPLSCILYPLSNYQSVTYPLEGICDYDEEQIKLNDDTKVEAHKYYDLVAQQHGKDRQNRIIFEIMDKLLLAN